MLPDPQKDLPGDYRSAGAFHELLGVQTAVDKHTFATKGGSLFQVLRVEGIDPDGLTDADLEHLTAEGSKRHTRSLMSPFAFTTTSLNDLVVRCLAPPTRIQ